MRILFMGTPDIAAECLKALYAAGHEICGVYTRRDKPVGRKQVLTAPPVKEVALEHGTPVFQPRTLRDGSEDANITAKKMHALGIHNGTQLQACTLEMLTRQFGKAGNLYYDFARGIDLRPVEPIRIRKSVGCEHTLEKDISLHSSAIIELYHVVTELLERLKRTNFSGNTLTLKIKFHDFNQITRSITQDSELTSMDKILPLAKKLLKEIDYESHPIRLIGLSVSNPKEEKEEIKKQWEQLSLEFKEWDD